MPPPSQHTTQVTPFWKTYDPYPSNEQGKSGNEKAKHQTTGHKEQLCFHYVSQNKVKCSNPWPRRGWTNSQQIKSPQSNKGRLVSLSSLQTISLPCWNQNNQTETKVTACPQRQPVYIPLVVLAVSKFPNLPEI